MTAVCSVFFSCVMDFAAGTGNLQKIAAGEHTLRIYTYILHLLVHIYVHTSAHIRSVK